MSDSYSIATAMFVFMLNICIVSLTIARASRGREPECVSKFDYDYKILQKLIELENQQKELETMLTEERAKTKVLESQRINYGSSYTRWGKVTCPGNGTSLIYSGYMAGAHYTHGGSGANFLCLTSQPIWDHYEEGIKSGARIFGVEYRFWEHRNSGASKFFGQNVFNKNATCAVCHVSRGTTIMIPGRNRCFDGWTKEYSGYLVSGYHSHKQASEFVCLDSKVDVIDGNESDDDEGLIYLVDGVCGKSLPCPPYVNSRELTCVVCSS